MPLKQVIIVRDDLKLSRGKLAVQVAHAAIIGYLRSDPAVRRRWLEEGQKKVVLKVSNLGELMDTVVNAEKKKLVTGIVRDAGLTEIPPGTVTAAVIGPDEEKKIDSITGSLPLLK